MYKKLNKFLAPILGLTPVLFTGLSTMVSCKKNIGTFETDSWSIVGELATQGLDALKQHYGLDSFIGLEREVEIFGVTHKVRVIGENEDTIVDGNGSPTGKKAALTFQFSTILTIKDQDTGELEPIEAPFEYNMESENTEYRWINSDARDWLNDAKEVTSFKYQLINAIGSNVLKTVSKASFNDLTQPAPVSVGGKGVSYNNECIFLLSLADIYSGPKDQLPHEHDGDEYYKHEGNQIPGGNLPYSFFRQNIRNDFQWYMAIDCLSLKDASGRNCNYWLRTGCIHPSYIEWREEIIEYYGQWVIGVGGQCAFWDGEDYPYPTQYDIGLAPCFCI